MEPADELTVLRIIADALNNGDYDADPEQWKALALTARAGGSRWTTVTNYTTAEDGSWRRV